MHLYIEAFGSTLQLLTLVPDSTWPCKHAAREFENRMLSTFEAIPRSTMSSPRLCPRELTRLSQGKNRLRRRLNIRPFRKFAQWRIESQQERAGSQQRNHASLLKRGNEELNEAVFIGIGDAQLVENESRMSGRNYLFSLRIE